MTRSEAEKRHQQAEPQVAADLLRTIVAFRAEISALPAESMLGSARASAARTVVAAMAREVLVARAFASVLCELGEEARELHAMETAANAS